MTVSQKQVHVLTETQIKQKLAGHKAHYTKKVNAATNIRERLALESKREAYIAERLAELQAENLHQIRRRAAFRAWETMRARNAEEVTKTNGATTKMTAKVTKYSKPADKTNRSSKSRVNKVGIRIVSK